MFKNTRANEKVSECKAIINGLGEEGGLYVFDALPKLDILDLCKKDLSYKDLCLHILKMLLHEFSEEELKWAIDNAYDNCFDTKDLVAFKDIDDLSILELYHGPTLAFKDMALRLMPRLFVLSKKKLGISDDTIILTATSGDTGGASLSGFLGIDGIKLVVFYPNNGVSEIQEKQMLHFRSDNTFVIALDGNFDDAQKFVKDMFRKYPDLSSSNSINIARLIPQIVYYVYSYIYLVKINKIKVMDKVNICVPSGNFGNILASYIASSMGLPVNNFICASNKNDVLCEFFNSGVYNKKREFYKTISPSMDILVSSNLERLLYMKFGMKRVRELYKELDEKGKFALTDLEKEKIKEFKSFSADEKETKDAIRKVFKNYDYLIDPHTAVAYSCYEKYKSELLDKCHTILVSTASPFKFAHTMCDTLGIKDDNYLDGLSKYANIPVPNELLKYEDKRNVTVWEKYKKDQLFEELLGKLNYGSKKE